MMESAPLSATGPRGAPIGVHTYVNPDHVKSSMEAINRMRQNAELCDVSLIVDEVAIQAHRNVIAAMSPYFHAMFTCDLIEKQQPEVTLHEVDAGAIAALVEYAYTGEVVISEDSLQVLLPACTLLQIQPVLEECCKFLTRQLHPSNCLGIRRLANTYDCIELVRLAFKLALHHFQEVIACEEFLLLPCSELEELISQTQLNTSGEEQVFTAVMKWVRYDVEVRKPDVARLLQHVRLPLLSRDFLLFHVEPEELIRDNNLCLKLILEAVKYHFKPEERLIDPVNERTTFRHPEGLHPYLFFLNSKGSSVYNPRTKLTMCIAPMQCKIGSHETRAVGMDKLVYVVGSGDDSSEFYDPMLNKWSPFTSMTAKRNDFGISTLGGMIYICGGTAGNTPRSTLRSVERFDPFSSMWSSCPPMKTKRYSCGTAVLDNCIFALGGFNRKNAALATVEMWDPRTAGWMAGPSMTQLRAGGGATACGGMVICAGGRIPNSNSLFISTKSSERLDLRRNAWEPIADMISARSGHALLGVGSVLYAVGDRNLAAPMEKYNPTTNQWVTRPCFGAGTFQVAVLECLNLEELRKNSAS